MASMYDVYHPLTVGAASSESTFEYGAETETGGYPMQRADFQPMHVSPYDYPYWPHFQNHYIDAPYCQRYAHQSAPPFHEQPGTRHVHQYHYNPTQEPYHHDYYQPRYAPRPRGQFPMFPQDVNGFHEPVQGTRFTPPSSPASVGFYANNRAGGFSPTQGYRSQVKKSPAVYNCEFPDCGRVYTKISLLNAHRRTHTDENAYHCNWSGGCGQNFAKPKELAEHLKSHT